MSDDDDDDCEDDVFPYCNPLVSHPAHGSCGNGDTKLKERGFAHLRQIQNAALRIAVFVSLLSPLSPR